MEIPWCPLAEKMVCLDTYKTLIVFSSLETTGKTGKREMFCLMLNGFLKMYLQVPQCKKN